MEFHVTAQDGETGRWVCETWSQVVQVGNTPVPSCVRSTARSRWTGDMRGRNSTHEWNLWFVWPRMQDSDNAWFWQGPKLWHCPSLYWKARYRPRKYIGLQEKKKWWRPDILICEMGVLHCHRVLLRIKQKVMQRCHAWYNRGDKYIYMYIYIYTHKYKYIYVCIYVYIHIYVYIWSGIVKIWSSELHVAF